MTGPWKEWLEDLRQAGVRSPRSLALGLGQRGGAPTGLGGLELELLQEMASALCRADEKVRRALEALATVEAAIGAATTRQATADAIDAFNRQRDAAHQARWELMVHREAIGMRRQDDLTELYPIPKRRKPPAEE